MVATAASAIHIFTGNNNIWPKGDLASRSLSVRLEVDRPDPENRMFKHPDPVGWTEGHRAEILAAFYTILLGNPMLRQPRDAECKTRFKMWWRVVGSAIEHAAELNGRDIDFQRLFLDQEEEDEDSTSLAEALAAMDKQWSGPFKASDVANIINTDQSNPHSILLRDFLFGQMPAGFIASNKSVGRRLKSHVGCPVRSGNLILMLRTDTKHAKEVAYFVSVAADGA